MTKPEMPALSDGERWLVYRSAARGGVYVNIVKVFKEIKRSTSYLFGVHEVVKPISCEILGPEWDGRDGPGIPNAHTTVHMERNPELSSAFVEVVTITNYISRNVYPTMDNVSNHIPRGSVTDENIAIMAENILKARDEQSTRKSDRETEQEKTGYYPPRKLDS